MQAMMASLQQQQSSGEMDGAAMKAQMEKIFKTKYGMGKSPLGEFVEVYAELICAAQEFVRTLSGGERRLRF